MAADADTDNGQRVTNAILGSKIDNLSSKVNDLSDNLKKHCEQSYVRDNRLSVLETKCAAHDDEIKTLRTKSDLWNFGNSVLASLATVLGLNK